jgi:hypothetical protein
MVAGPSLKNEFYYNMGISSGTLTIPFTLPVGYKDFNSTFHEFNLLSEPIRHQNIKPSRNPFGFGSFTKS